MTDSASLTAMKAELGATLPDSHAAYENVDPELFMNYLAWRSSILDEGVLPRTQKLLMVVALLTAQKSIAPLEVYASVARAQGVTAQELKEALRVGILFSGGAGVDAASNVAHLLRDDE